MSEDGPREEFSVEKFFDSLGEIPEAHQLEDGSLDSAKSREFLLEKLGLLVAEAPRVRTAGGDVVEAIGIILNHAPNKDKPFVRGMIRTKMAVFTEEELESLKQEGD